MLSIIKVSVQIIWKTIYYIFKYSIRTLNFMRITIINICLLSCIIIGIGIYFNLHYSNHNKSLPIKKALLLDLSGTIIDKPITYDKYRKFSQHLLNIYKPNIQENSLFDIVNIIRQAKNDPNITGLILSLKNFTGCDYTSLEYIGKILCEFKDSGKSIYSISDYYNQSQYFLASYANKIYLTPQGLVDLRGISTSKLYYKSLLDHLKINTHIFRIGTYKSAVEPFIRDNMSHHVRNEEKRWLNQLWQQYLKIISTNRNRTIQEIFPGIHKILDKLHFMQGDTANYALNTKLVDTIASHTIIEDDMKKIFGTNTQNTSFNAINMYEYNCFTKSVTQENNQIAIICINGAIIDGSNISNNTIGGDTVVHKIREARYNPKIKAIILRINSPGGSVNASELIRLELIATRNSGKPIIVSMGGVAASGGYWISTPADVIIASNSTITGSIGIFGIINTFEESLNSIGVHDDGVNTSPIANISSTKALPAEYMDMMQLYISTSYRYFINTVAESRYKTITDINKIAQGHIWLGCDALKNGLIDKIGDFDDAINTAAKLANITEYQLHWYTDKTHWIDVLLQQTDKIVHFLTIKLLNHYILLNNIHDSFNINHHHNTLQFIWNDPKNCYALFLDRVQYN